MLEVLLVNPVSTSKDNSWQGWKRAAGVERGGYHLLGLERVYEGMAVCDNP